MTLHIDIEKLALKDISGDDTLFADELGLVDSAYARKNYTIRADIYYTLSHERYVSVTV